MSARRRGVFVTGTDTGVGKTLVACALLRELRGRGLDAGAMKPVETGVGPEGPADARALGEASGAGDPLDDVCPYRFALPAAPSAAARAEGRRVEARVIEAAYARLGARHDWMVVEGAGGLLVPLDDDATMADLAARLALPLLVVTRASLGTINHTRLTLEAARTRGLEVAGLVISEVDGPLGAPDRANLEELLRVPGAPLLGRVPHLPEALAAGPVAAAGIDWDALLGERD